MPVQTVLDTHVFYDQNSVLGQIAYSLGNAYLETKVIQQNSSVLATLLINYNNPLPEELSIENLERTRDYIAQTINPLRKAKMKRDDAQWITMEFMLAADI